MQIYRNFRTVICWNRFLRYGTLVSVNSAAGAVAAPGGREARSPDRRERRLVPSRVRSRGVPRRPIQLVFKAREPRLVLCAPRVRVRTKRSTLPPACDQHGKSEHLQQLYCVHYNKKFQPSSGGGGQRRLLRECSRAFADL